MIQFDQYFFKWVETTTWFFSRPKPCQFRRQTDMVLRGLTGPPSFNSKPPQPFFFQMESPRSSPQKPLLILDQVPMQNPPKTYIHTYTHTHIYIYTYIYIHIFKVLYTSPQILVWISIVSVVWLRWFVSGFQKTTGVTWRLKPKTSSGQTTASTSSNPPAESSVESGAAPARKGQWWMLGIGILDELLDLPRTQDASGK